MYIHVHVCSSKVSHTHSLLTTGAIQLSLMLVSQSIYTPFSQHEQEQNLPVSKILPVSTLIVLHKMSVAMSIDKLYLSTTFSTSWILINIYKTEINSSYMYTCTLVSCSDPMSSPPKVGLATFLGSS